MTLEVEGGREDPALYAMSLGSVSRRNPASTSERRSLEGRPILWTSADLSTVNTWLTLTTLLFGRLASPGASSTLPGDAARLRLDVTAHTVTVAMRLRLNKSFWITTCGCR